MLDIIMLIDVDCRGDGAMHVRHRNHRANIYILEQGRCHARASQSKVKSRDYRVCFILGLTSQRSFCKVQKKSRR